jgi:hypothetical protein
MLIKLHQPSRAAWKLRLPFWVILTIYFWHLLATKKFCNWNLAIRYYKESNASLGFWRENEWFEICSVEGSFEQIWNKLDGLWREKYECEAWLGILQCGCSERSPYITTEEPTKPTEERCEDCGKYHQTISREQDEFYACPVHRYFFERWPSAKPLYSGRGNRPQVTGFTPYDAEDILKEGLKTDSLDGDRRLELARAIAKSELCSFCFLMRRNIPSDVREVLARGVRRYRHACSLLEDYRNARIDLSLQVITRMERLTKFWSMAFWTIRFFLVAGLVAIWSWRTPDWRTSLVLTTMVAGIWTILRIKEWLE